MNKGTMSEIVCRWLLFAAATCIALSCSSKHLDDKKPDPERLPFILKVDSGTGVETMEQGTTAGAFFVSKSDGGFYRKNEMLIADDGGRLMQGRDTVVPLDLDAYDFLAYSPYNSSWNDASVSVVEFEVKKDQLADLHYVASDLMLSYGIEKKKSHVEAVFNHAMAKILLHITDNTGIYDMRFASTTIQGMKLRSYIYMADGLCKTEESVIGDVVCNVQECLDRRASFAAVVPSQPVKDGRLELEIVLGDTEYDFTIKDVVPLEPGKVQIFSIRMTERGFELEDTMVADWEVGGSGSVIIANE